MTFDAESLKVGPMGEGQQYGGFRVTLQVDVGYGDVITPAARTVDFPALLESPAPRLRA